MSFKVVVTNRIKTGKQLANHLWETWGEEFVASRIHDKITVDFTNFPPDRLISSFVAEFVKEYDRLYVGKSPPSLEWKTKHDWQKENIERWTCVVLGNVTAPSKEVSMVWVLRYSEDWEYECHCDFTIGVYSSMEQAEKAQEDFISFAKLNGKFLREWIDEQEGTGNTSPTMDLLEKESYYIQELHLDWIPPFLIEGVCPMCGMKKVQDHSFCGNCGQEL